jgi:oxaloacetate decarboxylase alpha subunit
VYSVRVNGKSYTVEVAESGQLSATAAPQAAVPSAASGMGDAVNAVLAGNIFKVHVSPGATVEKDDPLLVVEAMKMETLISAPRAGTVTDVFVQEGDAVAVGDPMVAIA